MALAALREDSARARAARGSTITQGGGPGKMPGLSPLTANAAHWPLVVPSTPPFWKGVSTPVVKLPLPWHSRLPSMSAPPISFGLPALSSNRTVPRTKIWDRQFEVRRTAGSWCR